MLRGVDSFPEANDFSVVDADAGCFESQSDECLISRDLCSERRKERRSFSANFEFFPKLFRKLEEVVWFVVVSVGN